MVFNNISNKTKLMEMMVNYVIIVTSSVRVTGTKFLIDPFEFGGRELG